MKAILTNSGLSIVVIRDGDSQSYVISRENSSFPLALEAYKKGDEDKIVEIILNSQKGCDEYTKNMGCVFDGNEVTLNGRVLHGSIVKRIKQFYKEGLPYESLLKFIERIDSNPSSSSQKELYDFLDGSNIPIDEEGYFYAYKSVRSDYYSKTKGHLQLIQGKTKDGRIYNGVGETIECRRQDVDDNRSVQCSHGLHCGGLKYSGPGGYFHNSTNKIVIVKVDPKDVVSVPIDHECQKLRTCKYEVVSEYTNPLSDTLYKSEKEKDEQDCFCDFCLNKLDEYGYCYFCEDDEYECPDCCNNEYDCDCSITN